MKKLATILLIIAFGTAALAHSGVKNEAVIKRMELMASIAEQMKVVGSMAKGQATFDAEKARAGWCQNNANKSQVSPKSEA